MKSSLSLLLSLAGAAQVLAATEALHVNQATVTLTDANPPIDATAFVNLAPYEVSIYSTGPYEFSSLRYLTNYGVMLGEPGFLFQYRTNSSTPAKPLSWFENVGILSASYQMSIYASNVVGGLLLACGDQGYIKIMATNSTDHVDLAGTGLQAGANPLLAGPSYGLLYGLPNQPRNLYINDIGVSDSYWGSGVNGRLPGLQGPGQISPATIASYFSGRSVFGFTNTPATPPSYFPYIYITSSGGVPVAITSSGNSLPLCGGTFAAYDAVTSLRPANSPRNAAYTEYRQIVYVATNLNDLDVQVDFISSPGQNRWESIVQFGLTDTNLVDSTPYTSYLTLYDTSLTTSNGVYAQNQAPPFPSATPAAGTMRPTNYQLTREPYLLGGFLFGAVPGTNGFDFNFLYPSNNVAGDVDLFFSAYGAGLWQYFPLTIPSNPNLAVTDPTNHPGRVQIFANSVNLDQTRIRAENFVGIEARNLYGNPKPVLPPIDAPFVNFELGSTNPVIVISNTLPATVRRFYGQLAACSAVWSVVHTNFSFFETNVVTTRYHVLLVDNCLTPQPVTLHKFAVHGTAVELDDPLNIAGTMLLDAAALTIGPNGGLALPAGWSWGYTNVPRLLSLTNYSSISVPRDANFQITNALRVSIPTNIQGRLTNFWVTNIVTESYENIVNHGVITAESITLWSRYFEQTSTPSYPNIIQSGLGPISLNTLTAVLDGGQFLANSKITLLASDLTMNRTLLWAGTNSAAGGGIEISVTNRLTDGGPGANNEWHTSQGIQMDRLPLNGGDLLGTTLFSAPTPVNVTHTWPGRDLGRTTAGYSNNLALGRLVLDGAAGKKFRFRGPEIDSANQYALYVDYLELRNGAADFNNAIQFLGTNFILYFANANVPPKLINEASVGRRLRWVYDYAGALSSTNITIVQTNSYHGVVTNIYTFNIALVSNPDLNSDRDDRNNAQDPDPLFTSGDVDLVVSPVPGGVPPAQRYELTWWALAYATNSVEYATNLFGPQWTILTNFVNGPDTTRVSITNETDGSFRTYRVREDPYDLIGFPPTP